MTTAGEPGARVDGPVDARERARALDAADPLAPFRSRVLVAEPDTIYLDGNSLGRLPRSTPGRVQRLLLDEWGSGLVRSWHHWVGDPYRVGDLIGTSLLGARPGETLVADSTTVNLYKCAAAALDARPGRRVIVTDDDNFPTDRYLLAGLAAERGLEYREVHTDLDAGLDPAAVAAAVDADTALVSFSHTAYRSGALADVAAVTALAHAAGALTVWDLSHTVGSVPADLPGWAVDMAVGCSYKYLNGGPGAPAWLWVRSDLQAELDQPLHGWFSHADQFEMAPHWTPRDGIGRFAVGSPPIVGIACVEEGVRLVAEAGIDALRAKGQLMTAYLVDLADTVLAPYGFGLASPRDGARRGSHVSLHHPGAWQVTQALLAAGVVPDFRTPGRLRLGPAPLYTRFVEVYEAVSRLVEIMETGAWQAYPAERAAVT